MGSTSPDPTVRVYTDSVPKSWTLGAGLALSIVTGAGCAPRSTPAAVGAATQAPSRTADVERLPAGRGKEILQASCTTCHDLGEVTKFKGYYDRAQWRDIVVTMVEYGAVLEKNDVEVLSDYLVQHLGRR